MALTRCRRCGHDATATAGACPKCGETSPLGVAVTRTDPTGETDDTQLVSSADEPDDLLRSGDVVLERYRIEALLGVGGMGSVYRAEDLGLRQTVALKFLAASLAEDATYISMLKNEVRIARDVSHPNVCRVHDIGELGGRPFLSMEFIEGEDLKTLLRRAGRITGERADEIARQLCAGLYAAHQRGVIHRDLKPANVMIDDDGAVRITDFGIAARAGGDDEASAGTPAYMAPELFQGASASTKTDIYALGLVLHELYTGVPFHQGSSLTELVDRRSQPIHSLAVRIPGVDPEIERIVVSCLAPHPEERPTSAMAVLAALPGGDPLAEALRAGHTPSPELIAAVGGSSRIAPRTLGVLLAGIVVLVAAAFAVDGDVKLLRQLDLPMDVAVLEDRARAHITRFGESVKGMHHASGFELDRDRLDGVPADAGLDDWERRLSDRYLPIVTFLYRQNADAMCIDADNIRGRVTWEDPAPNRPGSILVRTDPAGRLIRYLRVPRSGGRGVAAPAPIEFDAVFEATGLDPMHFTSVPPDRVPSVFADELAAWEGRPDGPFGDVVRIEVATLKGRLVELAVDGTPPMTLAAMTPAMEEAPSAPSGWRYLARVALILGAFVLGWRSYVERRGDLHGAIRIGAAVFALVVLFTLLTGDSGGHWGGLLRLALKGMTHGAAVGLLLGLYYYAVEPFARQVWPQSIIGWERVLRGRLVDRRVGKDVLVGVLMGAFGGLVHEMRRWLPIVLGDPPGPPMLDHGSSLELLDGALPALGVFAEIVVDVAREAFKFFTSVVLLRLLLGRAVPSLLVAAVLWALAWSGGFRFGDAASVFQFFAVLALTAAFGLVLARVGFLALLTGFVVYGVLTNFPFHLDLDHWTISTSMLGFAIVSGLTLLGVAGALGPAAPAMAPRPRRDTTTR